jgi:hypothetical protein
MTMCTDMVGAPHSMSLTKHCPICNAQWTSGDEDEEEGVAFACGARLVVAGHGSWTLTEACPAKLSYVAEDYGPPTAPTPNIFELAMF